MKTSNPGKMYSLPKTHKRLSNIQDRPVISNGVIATEKVFDFLDFAS